VLIAATGLNSCSPTANNDIKPTTLIPLASGQVTSSGGTRLVNYSLSCGCPFKMQVRSADTSDWIVYEYPNFGDLQSQHSIRASLKAGAPSGMHRGMIEIGTVQPETTEDLRDTLRDSVMVP
ncbi:MAG TPA: hypothetical protein VFO76_08980, partial [Candidatus Kapabacteria bacterium]|nr:hypothetical protein [Candidatus Kapabacteria bacterium]